MLNQTVNLITRIFFHAFFSYYTLFALDNATNHACFVENTYLAKMINLGIDAKQP